VKYVDMGENVKLSYCMGKDILSVIIKSQCLKKYFVNIGGTEL
jgi:hypothetical protein